MVGLISTLLILFVLVWQGRKARLRHEDRIRHLRLRVHVNGIRGKSTVTRYVAAVLREGGIRTVAKTTGSAAMVIHPDGTESPIQRWGAATIVEQLHIVREQITPATEALVVECMAVQPQYQQISQDKIVNGNITVITNVREDHHEVMGYTLPEIADSLSNTIPYGGLLISAESQPSLRAQLERNAAARGSEFLYADPAWVADEDLSGFEYLAFKENIAIGLAVADRLKIPRQVALRGMRKAIPDVGVLVVQRFALDGHEVLWAPLFAANDRESTMIGLEALRSYHRRDAVRIGVLNNRYDRPVRAMQFADIAALDLNLDYYITFGAYEDQVTRRMVELGYPRRRIINLGFSRNPSLQEILDAVARLLDARQGLLVGMVNIHTPQAELLLEYFHRLAAPEPGEGRLAGDLSYASEGMRRRLALIGQLLTRQV